MLGRTFSFAVTFVALFALTYAFMAAVDALPEPLPQEREREAGERQGDNREEAPLPQTAEYPSRVVARDVGLDVAVENPTSLEVPVLDDALLRGAVRYPTSAILGQDGTVLLFGHSSYLPVVRNQNYKAFNGIQNLKKGAVVSVYAGDREYRYAVTGVRLADATEDVIELPNSGKFLTLVTCDSFGKKTERFIVTAELMGS